MRAWLVVPWQSYGGRERDIVARDQKIALYGRFQQKSAVYQRLAVCLARRIAVFEHLFGKSEIMQLSEARPFSEYGRYRRIRGERGRVTLANNRVSNRVNSNHDATGCSQDKARRTRSLVQESVVPL